jgi:predicted transcriptional regulator
MRSAQTAAMISSFVSTSRVLDENEQRLDALARKLDRCTVPEQNLGHRIQRKNAELEEYALLQQLSLDQNVT